MRLLIVAALILPGAMAIPTAGAESTVTRWNGGEWTVWRIDRSGGERRIVEYKDIRLRGGEALTLDAGGCAAQAVIWLPGASGPVPLAGLLRRPITIPDSAGPDGQALRLGFGACAGQPAAWVFVAVQRVEAAPSPMDLVWGASTDTNGVPLNPKWGQQVNEPGSPAT